MSPELLAGICFGAMIGWCLHSMFDVAWDTWVRPRLIRWFMGQ